MKHTTFILVSSLACALTSLGGERETFDFGWQYKYLGQEMPSTTPYDTLKGEGFKTVQLPHDGAIESPFLRDEPNETGKLPWSGYCWYRKSFDVAADFDAQNERYYLDFDGVMSQPQIFVNGKLAGEWAYGYASFRVDITPFLEAGKANIIEVGTHNLKKSSRWYPGAGIYRHVWLEKCEPVHIAHWGVFVTTPEITEDKATVSILTTVDNTSDKEVTLQVTQEVEGIAGATTAALSVTLAPKSSKQVKQLITLASPKLWDCENPNMYKLLTTIKNGDKCIDTKESSFGVREVEWRPEGFFLNGKRVELKGVCDHHDLGALGGAFYARGMERKIEILKGMGCNSIRTTHNPPAPEMLDLCDKHGILVIAELFDAWKHQKYGVDNSYHIFWEKWWQKDVANFVQRDRNHPSIIAWSGGNEIPEIHTQDGPEVSNMLKNEFNKYDPTRYFTVGVSGLDVWKKPFGESLDIFGFNYQPQAYGEIADARTRPFYASETISCVGSRGVYFFPLQWGQDQGFRNFQVSAYGLYAPGWANNPDFEFKAQDLIPNSAGQYVWTGFDYIGEPTPYNQDLSNINNFNGATEEEKAEAMAQLAAMGNKAPSRSSYFGIIDLAGFPKDIYYLFQSVWMPEKQQAHILPHWNWAGREGEITPVMVFSSGDEAELFLNGKSQGICKKGEGETYSHRDIVISKTEYRFLWDQVRYEPGELKVVVKKDGKEWATATMVTTGESTSVKAEADRYSIAGDSRDLSYISYSTHDAKGNFVPTDCREVKFSVTGPAELIGFCNGNPIEQRSMQDPSQAFFNGRIVAIVRGKRGESGKATVRIEAEGLPVEEVLINIAPATAEQLKN